MTLCFLVSFLNRETTGRSCTKYGAILDALASVALQDEMEVLDERFSAILQDGDVQRPLTGKMRELGIK